jgi:hypothetical protein
MKPTMPMWNHATFMSNPLIHDCCALNPLADNIRSIKQRRISDGGIRNQTEIMSCLLETEMMEKKDVLFFLFGFQSERRRSKVCTSSTFLLPLCFGNMEHHDHHHAAAALNSQSIQLWSNLVIHNPKCGNCK